MDIRKGVVVSRTNLVDGKKETSFPIKAVSLIVFVTLFLWGAAFFYQGYVQKKTSELQQQLNSIKTNRDYQKIAAVADTQSRLSSIDSSLAERVDWNNFFKKLEENTIPEVTFSSLGAKSSNEVSGTAMPGIASANSFNYKVSIKGTTIGLNNLAKQIEVFRGNKNDKTEPMFKDIKIEKIEIKKTDSGQIDSGHALDFNLSATINPQILSPNSNANSNPSINKQ